MWHSTRRTSITTCLVQACNFVEMCLSLDLFEDNAGNRSFFTFGGSSFHDLVAPKLPRDRSGANDVRVVLRSGCYTVFSPGQSSWCSRGSSTRKVAPSPGALVTETVPWCAATNADTIDRPRPAPPVSLVRDVSAR